MEGREATHECARCGDLPASEVTEDWHVVIDVDEEGPFPSQCGQVRVKHSGRKATPTCPACGFVLSRLHEVEWWCERCPWDGCFRHPGRWDCGCPVTAPAREATADTPP